MRPNMVFPVPTQKVLPAIWHWSLRIRMCYIVRRLRRKRRLKLGKLREGERLRERRGRKACDKTFLAQRKPTEERGVPEGRRKKEAVKNLLVSFFLSPRENFPEKIFFFLRHSFSHGPPHFENQELVFFICSGYIMFSFFPAGDMHGRRRWCCDERGAQGTDSPLYPFPFFLLVVFSSPPSPPCLRTSKQMRGPSSLLLLSPPLLGMGLVPSPTTKISPRPRKETKGENAGKDIFSFEFEPVIGSTPFLHAIKGNQNRPNLKHFQGSVTFFKYMCNS